MNNTNQPADHAKIEPGSVLCCTKCNRRKVITESWFAEAKQIIKEEDLEKMLPRLRCTCGVKGAVFIDKPRTGRDAFIAELRLLQNRSIDVENFIHKMKELALEGNHLADQWLLKSVVPGQLEEEAMRKNLKSRSSVKPNYNTKQWIDWDLGISRRPGKRNRMYE